MTKPVHDLVHAFHPHPVGHFRPRDHDHGQTQFTGGVDLGARTHSAGIAGDDPLDTPRTHHVQFAGKGERSARNDEISIWQRERPFGGVDEAERVSVLRPRRKRRDVLPPDGKKHARGLFRQDRDGGCDIIDLDPDIAGRFRPWLTLQCDQRRCRCRASRHCIAADLGCKGMGRVNHMRETLLPDSIGKTVGAAEAASSRRQRLIDWHLRSSGVGIDRVDTRSRNSGRQQIRFARSAQDEDAHG